MLQELSIAGNTISLYNVFNTLSGLILLAFILFQTTKYREFIYTKTTNQKKRTAFAFFQLLIISILLYVLLTVLNRAFANWFTNGNANYYGNLTSWLIIMSLLPSIFRVSPLKTMDLLSPGLPLSLFVAKLACFFHGCCHGFEMTNSFYYNQYTNQHEVPVQLIEAFVAALLFLFLLWYKNKNTIPGSVFPIFLILYSITRFFTEFLRADLPNVLGFLDAYQCMSIIYLFVGGFLLYLVWVIKIEKGKYSKSTSKHHNQ